MTSALSHWEAFYVIVGSSAAVLTGLQFVVITMISEATHRVPTGTRSISAFATPTVVHFCAALLIAALLSAPWSSLSGPAWVLRAAGLAGVLYGLLVIARARRQTEYRPVASDWIRHTALPLIAYAALLMAGISLPWSPNASLFVIGGTSLLLLFIGIHNSWDTVTYIAVAARETPNRKSKSRPS
ncbi:MAG TPA: hypothetical protein VFP58_07815 [Candidatus Eisenbacteria bacterium]|nr:hypothetical protein [Candidatus Eisenbacteria bacterium]